VKNKEIKGQPVHLSDNPMCMLVEKDLATYVSGILGRAQLVLFHEYCN
jgi:hypothetical protein